MLLVLFLAQVDAGFETWEAVGPYLGGLGFTDRGGRTSWYVMDEGHTGQALGIIPQDTASGYDGAIYNFLDWVIPEAGDYTLSYWVLDTSSALAVRLSWWINGTYGSTGYSPYSPVWTQVDTVLSLNAGDTLGVSVRFYTYSDLFTSPSHVFVDDITITDPNGNQLHPNPSLEWVDTSDLTEWWTWIDDTTYGRAYYYMDEEPDTAIAEGLFSAKLGVFRALPCPVSLRTKAQVPGDSVYAYLYVYDNDPNVFAYMRLVFLQAGSEVGSAIGDTTEDMAVVQGISVASEVPAGADSMYIDIVLGTEPGFYGGLAEVWVDGLNLTTTGLCEGAAPQPSLRVEAGRGFLSAYAPGMRIRVYDPMGRLVASSEGHLKAKVKSGVYFVEAGSERTKALVR